MIHKVAVITGTNSNLGLNIAYRLVEQLPDDEQITIVATSRTLPRVKEAIHQIRKFAQELGKLDRVSFDYIIVDFTNMISVLNCQIELQRDYNAIHYLYINAAQGCYDGINWFLATKEVIIDPLRAVTYPNYKIQKIGVKSMDGMGLVFQANVFGPYYLLHRIEDLLVSGECTVVWISSIMSDAHYLSLNDIELLKSRNSYEGSKRLVDLLHAATYQSMLQKGIKQYLVQPGIFLSFSFYQYLNWFTYFGMLILFYIARLMGSKWHNIDGYKAANSPIYVTHKCESAELGPLDLKYGSATDISGKEYIVKTEINDLTGSQDVLKYLQHKCVEWDEKLKEQIKPTRQIL